jgi:hypothetical protein
LFADRTPFTEIAESAEHGCWKLTAGPALFRQAARNMTAAEALLPQKVVFGSESVNLIVVEPTNSHR